MAIWTRFIKDPLLHFLIAGGLVFLAYGAITAGDAPDVDDQTIVVDRANLLTFLQFRTRAFDAETAGRSFDALSSEMRQTLIESYVREEALYRDALALGLDQGDDVIRRRMVQKAEYLAQGFVELGLEITDEMVATYFSEHSADYREPPIVTFTHVFFDAEGRGREAAAQAARAAVNILNSEHVPFAEAVRHGDRFLFHLNYVERGPTEIAAHFGQEMTRQVFELPPSNTIWHGPFVSPYGAHLVMITRNDPARDPSLDEMRERVASDLTREEINRRTNAAIQSIVAHYDVRIELDANVAPGEDAE